jgi:heptosyltransferase-3
MKKILVLRGGALGDFIVTLPALALLRREWPNARIELAGNATAAQLAVNRGLLDAAHSQHEARWARLYGDSPLLPEFAAWLSEFDLVVSFWPDPEGELRRRFPLHDRQRFVSGAAMPERNPAAAHYCEPLRPLGIQPSGYFYSLTSLNRSRERERVDEPPLAHARGYGVEVSHEFGNRILIHPGSGSPRKNWPRENWCRLIDQLGLPVSLILGEAERSNGEEAFTSAKRLGVKPLHLVNAPLEELVDALSHCRLFVGHDSGISHLAAASGARCVLLFGPTEPACWAPPAPNVRVLRNRSDPASLSVDVVRDAVQAALADRR